MKSESTRTQSAHKRMTFTRSKLIALSLIVLATSILLMPGVRSRVFAAGQTPKGDETKISESAALQIQALLAEKESRTPAQQKLDSQLVYAIKFRRGDSLAAAVPTLQTGVVIDQQGKTTVDITARIGGSLLEDLVAAGADVSYVYPRYNSLRATVPLDQLEAIAAFPQVIFIMPKQEGQVWRTAGPSPAGSSSASGRVLAPDFSERAARVRTRLMEVLGKTGQQPQPTVGSQQSQGDTCHKANTARSTFGANGAGVRIGVLSNGVVSLAASQALGDLGMVTVLPGQVGTGDEGTAMLEIIHDLAPGAELFYATANPIIAAFAQNVRDLRTAGCDIIVDDVFYFVETPFQDGQAPSVVSNTNGGLVIQAVKDVTAAGAMYFSSAGNQGNKDDGTSSCYQGDFVNGGTLALVPGGNLHDFDPTAGVQQFDLIQTGSGNPVNLYWADPLGGSTNDYDLFILNSTSTAIVASSTNVQNGTQDPFEQTSTGNTTNNRVVVLQKTGAADRFLHITINANGVGKLGTSTEGTTKGHSIAVDAYSCGATPASAPGPFPSPFSSSNVTETFSSDGPRRIFFNADSSAITPGNFSSSGGTLRQKPDITAADKVSVTGVGGFGSPFSGTSAAAPHAGAIAGLLKSAFPSLTPTQVRTILTSTAIDIEAPGVDRDSGVGIIMAFEALQSNGAVASANFEVGTVTATEVCCNANTFIEPGESGSLMVQLTNTGVANATGITTTLSTTTPNVNILSSASAYPNLATSASGTNTTLFQFMLGSTAPCDLKVNFTLTINYTGGNSPKVAKFSVQTGRPPVSVATTIDASAPPASADYMAITGTQTNRVTRDGRASTCNLPKAVCPGITTATSPRFDAYTFSTCSGNVTRCITVTLTTPCPSVGGGTQLFTTAYTGSFNPASICTNYLADSGSSPSANATVSYTFNVPPNTSFVVVVSEVPLAATNCSYTLTVSGVCLACPTAAKVDNVTANGYNDGQVLLQWKSSQEVDNLGYNVYREQNGARVKITPQLVAGSALMVGPGTTLTSGNSYAWADAPTGDFGSVKYWLEDIDLKGQSKWTGPISVLSNAKGSPSLEQSALLARLGMHETMVGLPPATTPAPRAARLPQPAAQQQLAPLFSLASGPAVKLSIKQEGWYRVSQPALIAAGLDPNVNPRFLQMFVDGREVPITVAGEQDGKFDPADAVEFYGVGLDSAASDTHVYWLAAGAQPGKRIASVSGKGGLGATGGFPYTVERKDRTVYFSGLRNGDAENFFGAVIAGQPVDQALWIQHLNSAPGAPAVVEVALQGVTQSPHSVRLQLNGTDVGAVNFESQSAGKVMLSVPSSLLREGENQVRLAAQNGQSDVSLLDSIRITYSHSYLADSNLLRLTAAAGQQISVDGFTSSSIRLVDITDPNGVQALAATIKPTKAGYAITATVPGSGDRLLLALADSQIKQPARIAANVASSWRNAGNGADLLIVTQRDFFMALGPLAAVRQSQGLSVALVDIEDVFDEFSYGARTPQALKDFISFAATSWKKKPRFALLAGQASYDPRNYLGFGDSDIVPTKLIDTGYMETASDEWLGDLNGDGVADLAVGRLPCRSLSDAAKMVRKITDYERSSPSSEVFLVADANDGYDFEAISSELQGLIPGDLRVTQLNRGRMDGATAKSQLIDAIQRGQKIVNYTGHGNVNQWRGNLLTNEDASVLTNADHLSLFVMMTCLNGYFDDPALDSLAASLMKAERGGAVAVWASSGMTGPGSQAALNQQMFRALFDTSGGRLTLGEAVMRAKSSIGDPDVRRTWILFGDPSMKLK